jgi:hypothetical protein
MHNMSRTNNQMTTPAVGNAPSHGIGQGSLDWLGRRRGFVIAVAVAAAATALALGQHWLAVADLLPLLFTLPCAVMMFMCMKGMNHGQQTGTPQASARNEMPTATDIRN